MTPVDELEGAQLDLAVARALGLEQACIEDGVCVHVHHEEPGDDGWWTAFRPTASWALAGPIIEREMIQLSPPTSRVHRNPGGRGTSGLWSACTWHAGVNGRRSIAHHPTSPLVAAMRCFVRAKFGDA